jgi:hypothetical protein
MVAAWEGVARAAHDATGIDAPVSAFDLAAAYGLICIPDERGGAFLDGDDVHYDCRARPVRQHGLVAHEVAHHLLRLHGEDDSEPAARYTAGALMLPRAAYDRDLRETAWDLMRLQERHPNASAELCARRISELRDAVVTVIDHGKMKKRIGSPWMTTFPARMTALERELADAALVTGEMQSANALLAAYPFIDGTWRRVIVVAEARQLSLRL